MCVTPVTDIGHFNTVLFFANLSKEINGYRQIFGPIKSFFSVDLAPSYDSTRIISGLPYARDHPVYEDFGLSLSENSESFF